VRYERKQGKIEKKQKKNKIKVFAVAVLQYKSNSINQSFCQFLECQAPQHKPKAPPAETHSPPIKNFLATVLVSSFKALANEVTIF